MEDRGELSKTPFPLLLSRLYMDKVSGSITIKTASFEKQVYLSDGSVIFAASNDRNDRLGEMLVRRGRLRLPDFQNASLAMAPGIRFGTILVERNLLSTGQLVWAVTEQVKEIVFSLFDLRSGGWRYSTETNAGNEVITLSINTTELLHQGVGRMDTISWFLDTFSRSSAGLTLLRPVKHIIQLFNLSDAELVLINMLAKKVTLDTLCFESQLSHFKLLKLLWTLMILDLLVIARPEDTIELELENPEFVVTRDDLDDLMG